MRRMLVAALLAFPAWAGDEQIVGLPCEGCEGVFVGLPSEVPTEARIAPEGEEGDPMTIEGTVVDAAGRPAPGIIVYAYHTDPGGVYPREERMRGTAAYRHGRLRGWARTDTAGRYRFETIRPGGYPGSRAPAHIHMHVIEPGRCTYYIGDIEFLDDPRLTEQLQERHEGARGGSGLADPARDARGHWRVRRDITLGLHVPGYERCSSNGQ